MEDGFITQETPSASPEVSTFEFQPKKAQMIPDLPITPKGERIVLTQSQFVQRSSIIIPDVAQQKPTTGTVVGIGPDVEEGFTKLGELVVFLQYSGVPIVIVGKDGVAVQYLVCRPEEIAGELNVTEDKVKEPDRI